MYQQGKKYLDSLHEQNTSTTILPSDFKSIGSDFGSLFKDDLLILTLPKELNFQRYCISYEFLKGIIL